MQEVILLRTLSRRVNHGTYYALWVHRIHGNFSFPFCVFRVFRGLKSLLKQFATEYNATECNCFLRLTFYGSLPSTIHTPFDYQSKDGVQWLQPNIKSVFSAQAGYYG